MATGFDPKFLSTQVSLPAMSGAAADDAVVLNGSSVIDYTHFSLALSASRHLARWVAWNVDGKRMQKLSRSSMKFRLDPRVPHQMQVGDELYSDNRIDRGHVARRADLTWGSDAEAHQANSDSFYFTNITPQVADFNQSSQGGIWGRIEDALYDEVDVDDLRISVFGGPVFSDDDPVYREVALPKEFWKVVIFVEDDELKARAFLLTQKLDRLEILDLDEFGTYQVSVAELSKRTGLDFGDALVAAGALGAGALYAPRPIEALRDIRW
ncbi:DNA/RNA non-specific endonuclease [Luteococcus sanguinis]|uniref:DNA/RNA non-specific endonuclease n=1 Tax=Luteococcus sanguinis TaxID=174038 RepID=A0ABW1WWI3_9ACTN